MNKVLVVAPFPPPVGGMATWTELLRRQSLVGPLSGRWCPIFVDSAVRWRPPGSVAWGPRLAGGALQALRDLGRIASALRRHRPRLVHLTSSAGPASLKDLLVMVLARLAGARGILHYHAELGGGLSRLAARSSSRWASAVVALDARSEQRLRGSSPVFRLANFVETDELEELRAHAPRADQASSIVYVGRVSQDKGVPTLLRACAGLAELHLVGRVDPPLQPLLRQFAGPWLRVHGALERSQALQILSGAGVVVLPSRTEGFPYAILEAMALARPVVATAVGAVPEMLQFGREGACGLSCRYQDEVDLRSRLESLLLRPECRHQLGCNGLARVQRHYTPQQGVAQLSELWDRVVGPRGIPERSG